jgi:hypothetical protein
MASKLPWFGGKEVFLTERKRLLLVRKGGQREVAALGIHKFQAVMEDAELAFNPPVVAGEAVEVAEDGFRGQGGVQTLGFGDVLEAVEAELAEVLNGDAVHEHPLDRGLGMVVSEQVLADVLEDRALVGIEVGDEEVVGGTEAVFQCV